MARGALAWGLVSVVVGITAIACGSSDGSEFGDGQNQNGAGTSGGNGFGSSGSSTTPDPNSVGTVGGVTPGSACANSSAGTTRPPAYLVFMYDRSGSMGDAVGNTTKWNACKAGLTNFFTAASSQGIHASIAFFGTGNNNNTICSAATYATPVVAMTALPDNTFSTKINGQSPGGNTPTLPAIQGAITYAQQVKAGLTDNGKVAIVLVTDGDPNGCSSTVANVAAAESAVKANIPTYVVGIGTSVTNLQAMAAGGGTTAIQVNTTSPQQVTTDLENALGNIATQQLGCEYGMPQPPAGQTLNVNAVNVDYTPTGKPQTTLAYSADCSDPNGWHYDSVTNPTKIVMCANICTTLKADVGGKVDIIFGCATAVQDGGAPPVN